MAQQGEAQAARPFDRVEDPPDTPAAPPVQSGMLQSLQLYPIFRFLIFGTLATNTAFWMYQVAVGWLALEVTDSPFFVGLAGFAGGIPMLLISIPAGVIIDRYDRRSVLLVAQVAIMIVSLLFAVLVATDLIAPWSMIVLVAINGTVMSFIFPTRSAIVGSVVPRHDLANAVALNAASQNSTRVFGPSLAGVLIAVVGVATTFAIAAALQILALAMTWRMPSSRAASSGRPVNAWASMAVGFRVMAHQPAILALIILSLAPTIFVMPYINLMPVFARDVLDLGSTGLGILLAAIGLGTVGGALSVARSATLRERKGVQLAMAVAFGVLIVAFSLTSFVPLAAVFLFGAGWVSAVFLALNQTAVQMSVDDDVRGRVLSISLVAWGMLPLGQLLVGGLANAMGTANAMIVSCVIGIVLVGVIAVRYPSLRQAA